MEIENNNENKNVALKAIIIILSLIIIALLGWIIFKGNIFSKEKPIPEDNKEEINSSSIYEVCTGEGYDNLTILSMENGTDKIGAMGGSTKGYNVTTTVTKEHSYTSTPEESELYAFDSYPGTLLVLYKNKLYYVADKEIVSKYCESKDILIDEAVHSTKMTCDYSKIDDEGIKEFNIINIDVELKAIGTFGNAGSGFQTPYGITTDGKVIQITEDSDTRIYNGCRVMYDDSEYPIDRIFNMFFYDGIEYTILLKDGTLITRDVDREHPIDFEH